MDSRTHWRLAFGRQLEQPIRRVKFTRLNAVVRLAKNKALRPRKQPLAIIKRNPLRLRGAGSQPASDLMLTRTATVATRRRDADHARLNVV